VTKILDLTGLPHDALERLLWLSGVMEQVQDEMKVEWQRAYYDARLQQRLDAAEALGLHSHKKVMAFTRAENNARGRGVRWGDRRG
jgi:hypothetical protein